MCCPLLLIAFFGPRTALVYLWITGYLDGVFVTPLWPLLGFLFLPFTTLVYVIAIHHGGVTGFSAAMVILAFFIDIGVLGGSEKERRRRRITD